MKKGLLCLVLMVTIRTASAGIGCNEYLDGKQCGCYNGYCWGFKFDNSVPGDPWCYTQMVGVPIGQNLIARCSDNSQCRRDMRCGNNNLYFGTSDQIIPYAEEPDAATLREKHRTHPSRLGQYPGYGPRATGSDALDYHYWILWRQKELEGQDRAAAREREKLKLVQQEKQKRIRAEPELRKLYSNFRIIPEPKEAEAWEFLKATTFIVGAYPEYYSIMKDRFTYEPAMAFKTVYGMACYIATSDADAENYLRNTIHFTQEALNDLKVDRSILFQKQPSLAAAAVMRLAPRENVGVFPKSPAPRMSLSKILATYVKF